MKRIYLLSLLSVCFCLIAFQLQGQSEMVEKKKVVVVKKTIDEDGEVVLEKIIAEGKEAEDLLEEIHSDEAQHQDVDIHIDQDFDFDFDFDFEEVEEQEDVMIWKGEHSSDHRNIEVDVKESDGVKVIRIQKDGEAPRVIELAGDEEMSDEMREQLEEEGVFIHDDNRSEKGNNWISKIANINVDLDEKDGEKVIRIKKIVDGEEEVQEYRINGDVPEDLSGRLAEIRTRGFNWHDDDRRSERKGNCAALGVYVETHGDEQVEIQSIIGGSGAEEVGMQEDDIITMIDGQPIKTYADLNKTLNQYEPGDVVSVSYDREGTVVTVDVELRAWKELPSMKDSWRAKISCGDENYQELYDFTKPTEETVTKKIIIIKKKKEVQPEAAEEIKNVNESPLTPRSPERTLELSDFNAFPNPTGGVVQVSFTAEPTPTLVRIMDLSGKEVFSDNVKTFDGYYDRQVDLTGMQGAFILSVEQNNKIFSEQIVVN